MALAGPRHRLARRHDHRQEVVAVHLDPRETRTPPRGAPASSPASAATAGIEIAHWLLTHTKTIGAWKTPAKFIASWTIPSELAPSPK